MSNPIHLKRAGRAVVALSAVLATAPLVRSWSYVSCPGTALTGFGLPAVVNGATHNNDGVANQAKADLTTAYNVAAVLQPRRGPSQFTG